MGCDSGHFTILRGGSSCILFSGRIEIGMVVFVEGGKRKTQESNPGHNGWGRALSPLRHPSVGSAATF